MPTDKERMRWLVRNFTEVTHDESDYSKESGEEWFAGREAVQWYPTLRRAIDAAIKAEKASRRKNGNA